MARRTVAALAVSLACSAALAQEEEEWDEPRPWAPAVAPVLIAPTVGEAPPSAARRRDSDAIALIVIGNLVQVFGVALLAPAATLEQDSTASTLLTVGTGAAVLGTGLSAWGWALAVRGWKRAEKTTFAPAGFGALARF